MPLPDQIQILPLAAPVSAQIAVPGSKSLTNRALVLAALADRITTLQGALWSQDTEVMVQCLQQLGFVVSVAPDPREPCNRTLTVRGCAGLIPQGGSPERPLDLFVANAGTTARFLTAMVCLGNGVYRLDGSPRMRERPQQPLFQALRQLGYRLESPNDRLPVVIHGGGPRPGKCRVSVAQSSQFASALLLAAGPGGWEVEVTGENPEESPYLAMTLQFARQFAAMAGNVRIEPDASSGSYFWAAAWLAPAGSRIQLADWPTSGWQIDAAFPDYLPLPRELSRQKHLGDSIMTAMMLAPFANAPIRFTDLGRLRLQECERVTALRRELTKCGAQVQEQGDTLLIYPSPLHGAEIDTYDDHRLAMCFATLGLKVPGLTINNPACVKKTFPSFFQKLAAAPPHGLGAQVRDARTGRPLGPDELFAD